MDVDGVGGDVQLLRVGRGASRGGGEIWGSMEEGRLVVAPVASLRPSAEWYPTHAAKGASWMGHPAPGYAALRPAAAWYSTHASKSASRMGHSGPGARITLIARNEYAACRWRV